MILKHQSVFPDHKILISLPVQWRSELLTDDVHSACTLNICYNCTLTNQEFIRQTLNLYTVNVPDHQKLIMCYKFQIYGEHLYIHVQVRVMYILYSIDL